MKRTSTSIYVTVERAQRQKASNNSQLRVIIPGTMAAGFGTRAQCRPWSSCGGKPDHPGPRECPFMTGETNIKKKQNETKNSWRTSQLLERGERYLERRWRQARRKRARFELGQRELPATWDSWIQIANFSLFFNRSVTLVSNSWPASLVNVLLPKCDTVNLRKQSTRSIGTQGPTIHAGAAENALAPFGTAGASIPQLDLCPASVHHLFPVSCFKDATAYSKHLNSHARKQNKKQTIVINYLSGLNFRSLNGQTFNIVRRSRKNSCLPRAINRPQNRRGHCLNRAFSLFHVNLKLMNHHKAKKRDPHGERAWCRTQSDGPP